MSQVWSEINKVVNFDPPASQWGSTTSVQGDIVDMEAYKRCTFLIITGATCTGSGAVTVQAGLNSTSCATEIAFKYRSITSGDTYGALTDAVAGTGFNLTASTPDQYHIVEVDAPTVCAGTTAGATSDYDHCALSITNQVSAINACVVAILSEPRYPQAILDTAIG